jgi:hypothetical protein
MSITRRQFLLGTSAGLILPTYFDKAQSYFANHGEPLLAVPKKPRDILYASSIGKEGRFELLLNEANYQMPTMSIREFAEWRGQSLEELVLNDWCWEEQEFDPDSSEWDEEADSMMVYESMSYRDWPSGAAHDYLCHLDLGVDVEAAISAGELRFINGESPGNDYVGVEARDAVTLTMLQARLNELGKNVRIELT